MVNQVRDALPNKYLTHLPESYKDFKAMDMKGKALTVLHTIKDIFTAPFKAIYNGIKSLGSHDAGVELRANNIPDNDDDAIVDNFQPPQNNPVVANNPQRQSGIMDDPRNYADDDFFDFLDDNHQVPNNLPPQNNQVNQNNAHRQGGIMDDPRNYAPDDHLIGDDFPVYDFGFANVGGARFSETEKSDMRNELLDSPMYLTAPETGRGDEVTRDKMDRAIDELFSRPTAVNMIRNHGLTICEAVSVYVYTTNAYAEINTALRRESTDNPLPIHVECLLLNLNACLEKLPSATGVVSRSCGELPGEVKDRYKPGNTVSDKAVLSSSQNPNAAAHMDGENQFVILLKEQGSAGKLVASLSEYGDNELEVIFPPKTEFSVVLSQLTERENGAKTKITDYVMKEI